MPAEGGRGGGGAGGGAYRIHELISERPAEWGFSSLAPLQASGASGAGPGLSMGIPDTILCEEGSAHRWLFTSKDGVILRKRRLNPNSVTERISRLAETNPHNPFLRSGILRFSDGRVQALNQAVVNEILTKFPTMGQGVVAFQSFIQGAGNSGTIHRCTYSVIDDKANTVCETATFTTLEQAEPGQDRLEWRNDRPPGCVPSRARAVNRALQGATKEIVRHIETSQREPSRILKVQLDYAIDPTGAIWLLWVGPSTVAVGAAAQDLRLVLGDAAAAESQLKAMARTQRRMEKTGDAGAASMLVDSPRLLGGIVGGATAAVELSSPSRVAIRATGSDLGASLGSSVSPKPSMTALKSTMTVGLLPAARGVGAGWGGGCNDKVACSGDFCRVVVQDPREDADDPRRGCAAASLDQSSCSSNSSCGAPTETGLVKAVAMRLFSAQELSILRRDETFRRQLQEGQLDELRLENLGPEVGSSRQRAKANPGSSPLEARARVLWKSIAMARSERSSEPHSSTDRGDDSAGHTRTTESSNFREASVRRADPRRLMALGAVDGCPRDPYEAVGVCSACFIVYTLLDRARAILKKQQEEADEQAAATSRAMRVQTPPTVSSPLRVTNAGQSTKGRPGSPGTLVPVHAASASGGQARKRLNATTNPLSSQYGTQSLLLSRSQRATKSSKRGFGSLDDYLRGKARSKGRNGTTDKAKAKEKAKLAGTTDAASSSLQVGRVLVGESDEAAAAEVRRLLEQAGFMVTTEGDGRRILELLLGPDSDLAGATGYDVVMLSTSSLHLVDAFEVTSAVRDSEKRRRSQLARERAELVKTEGRSALMEAGEVAQLPIIAFAHETGPNDLRRYMLAGMDGCVSKPVKSRALLNTIHAAVPHHLAKERPTPPPSPARGQNVTSFGALKGSSAVAETALPSATRPAGRDEDVHGALQVRRSLCAGPVLTY
jgi:CheY-like chemotaxis protein